MKGDNIIKFIREHETKICAVVGGIVGFYVGFFIIARFL